MNPMILSDKVAGMIGVRNDPASGFVFNIQIAPFAARQFVKQVLPRTVGGDSYCVAKQNGSGVGCNFGMSIEVLGKHCGLRTHRVPVVATVGMVL